MSSPEMAPDRNFHPPGWGSEIVLLRIFEAQRSHFGALKAESGYLLPTSLRRGEDWGPHRPLSKEPQKGLIHRRLIVRAAKVLQIVGRTVVAGPAHVFVLSEHRI